MIARWDSGAQVPSVRTLLRISQATGFELVVGLHAPGAAADEFVALSVVEGRKTAKTRVGARNTPLPRKTGRVAAG